MAGLARHLADGVEIHGQEKHLAAHPRGGQRRFRPGVARSDDDHVVMLRILEHGWKPSAARSLEQAGGGLEKRRVNVRSPPHGVRRLPVSFRRRNG